jgi:hypothetical protein
MTLLVEFVALIYNTIVVDLFGGNHLLFGLFATIIMGVIGFKLHLGFDAIAISLVALFFVLAGFGFLPFWIIPVILLGIGLLIGFGLLRIGKR